MKAAAWVFGLIGLLVTEAVVLFVLVGLIVEALRR